MATYGHPAWKYSAVKRFGTWLRLGTRAKQPKGAVERELLPSDMTNLDFSISSSHPPPSPFVAHDLFVVPCLEGAP